MNGEDVLQRYLTIRQAANTLELDLAADGGTLTGDVTNSDGQSVTAGILLIPRRGQPKILTAPAGGHFTASDLAPGEYTVSAWDRASDIEYSNTDWMNRNGSETTVTIVGGQAVRITLKLQIAPPI